uniref:Reverse transcriptase domain-containing protein n=1 Tax=Tanacetum cinerariifolium TaxID=118510 RepID=A0A6L2NHJ9_TANCI|nr:hypothetical protein [Tanacetum cinerariifolium]
MTRSSTKELFTPFKDLEREFRSFRKIFKTLSLDESRSLVFDLFSYLEENSDEEVAETMAKTMEEYMRKTRADYCLGRSDHEDAKEHIEKVLEIVDLFHTLNITQDQIMLRTIPTSLTGAEVILFYNGLEVPTRQILDSNGAILTKRAADAKLAIQEMADYSQKWHNKTSRARSTKTSDGLDAIQAKLKNLGREIKKVNEKVYATQVAFERICDAFSVIDLYYRFTHSRLHNLRYAKDVKVSLILGRAFLSTIHAKIDVFKRKITLRVGEEKIIFKSVKPTTSLIKRVYMLSLRERTELNLDARLIRETLVLNRLLDLLNEDYIKLNDLNVPLALRRDQVDDLMPTIEEDEVVDKHVTEEVKAKNDNKMVRNILGYPNDYDEDEKIYIECVEDMNHYLDEGMGEMVVGEPFCKISCVETRRFDGIITIHNKDESVTYQMV